MVGKKILFIAMVCLVSAGLSAAAHAQGASGANTPKMPKPLETMALEGAQIRYMGNEMGMEGWLAIHKGQEQYFYVTPKGDALVMGLMFETESGRLVTIDQVARLQRESGGVLDLFSATRPAEGAAPAAAKPSMADIKTPSEKLMEDVENSNFVPLGAPTAPAVYAFIDPQCPHCHSFIQDLRGDYLTNNMVQVRMIPVGFRDETRAQAAFLLGAPDGAERFLRHLDGDGNALPVTYDINQQGVERNMAVMQAWKLNVTPLIVYRAGDGAVKIVQGRPKSIPALIADLNKRS